MEQKNLFFDKTFKNLINILITILIIFLAILMFSLTKDNELQDNTISVTGYAEIYAKPDVAQITLTVLSENKDLGIASNQNSEKMNAVISFLEESGIGGRDMKTSSYNIYPRYEYKNDYQNRYLASYEVRQSLTIKIRDLDIVGDVISGATSRGANDISNLEFIIDNNELLKEQARQKAIENAKIKAQELGKDLGVSITEIIGFYESTNTPVFAQGNSKMYSDSVAAPSIQTGENSITSNVTIVYKIK